VWGVIRTQDACFLQNLTSSDGMWQLFLWHRASDKTDGLIISICRFSLRVYKGTFASQKTDFFAADVPRVDESCESRMSSYNTSLVTSRRCHFHANNIPARHHQSRSGHLPPPSSQPRPLVVPLAAVSGRCSRREKHILLMNAAIICAGLVDNARVINACAKEWSNWCHKRVEVVQLPSGR